MEFERQETRDKRGEEEGPADPAPDSDADAEEDEDSDSDSDRDSAADEELDVVTVPVSVAAADCSASPLTFALPTAKENGDGIAVPVGPGRTEIPHAC